MRRPAPYPPQDPGFNNNKWYQAEPVYSQSHAQYYQQQPQQQIIRGNHYGQPVAYSGYGNFAAPPPPPPPQASYNYPIYPPEQYYHESGDHYTAQISETHPIFRNAGAPRPPPPQTQLPPPIPRPATNIRPPEPVQKRGIPEKPPLQPIKTQEAPSDLHIHQNFNSARFPVPQPFNIISRGNLPSFEYIPQRH